MKQMTGVEPASSAWEADILPMYYICVRSYSIMFFEKIKQFSQKWMGHFREKSQMQLLHT